MKLKKYLKFDVSKIIAFLLLLTFLSGHFMVFNENNRARAYDPGTMVAVLSDTIGDFFRWGTDVALTAAMDWLKIRLANEIQDKILRLANGITNSGFVADWENFLTENRVEVGIDWLNDFFGVNLCADIRPQLKILLLSKFRDRELGITGAKCTLNEAIDNAEELANHLAQGRWLDFERKLHPENNELGIIVEATTGLEGVLKKGEERAILGVDTSKGYEGVYKCVETNEKGFCERKEKVTSGSITQRIEEYVFVDLPMSVMENAENIGQAAIRGLVMTSLNRVYDGVRASSVKGGPTSFEEYWQQNAPPITITGMTAEERAYCVANQTDYKCRQYVNYCNDAFEKNASDPDRYPIPAICNELR